MTLPVHTSGLFDEVDARFIVVPGVLTERECHRIVARNRPLTVPHEPVVGGSLWAHPIDDAADLCGVQPRLFGLFQSLLEDFGWPIDLDIGRFGVSGYTAGDSMAAHYDDEVRGSPPWDIQHRGISFSLQLSPPGAYEGGELQIRTGQDPGRWSATSRHRDDVWETAPADRGALIAFGSSTMHEVRPVTAGERWVLLGWGYCNHDQRSIR